MSKIAPLLLLLGIVTLIALFLSPLHPQESINLPQDKSVTDKPEPEVQELSLEAIFDVSLKAPQEDLLTVVATGDVMLGRKVNTQSIKYRNFTWPFLKTATLLRDADLTLINLESPLVSGCQPTETSMLFCADPGHAGGLAFAGVDVASLANNHGGDYGRKGIEDTQEILSLKGISLAGVDGHAIKEVKGKRIAVLAYTDVTPNFPGPTVAEENRVKKEVKAAREEADIVIVTFHWGVEYVTQPTERQKRLGRLAIDSGASLVIGHHPHWIQPVEVYKERLIVYSLGNFIFDQMWSQKTREGLIGRFVFHQNRPVDAEFIPVLIEDFGQPRLMDEADKQRVIEQLKKDSQSLSSKFGRIY